MQAAGFTTPEIDAKLAARGAEVLSVYGTEAAHFKAKVGDMNRLPNLVTEIPKLRALSALDASIRYSLVATWRQLSGLQHGHTYALMVTSDKSEMVKIPGGVQMLASRFHEGGV